MFESFYGIDFICGRCPHLQAFLKKSLAKNFNFCERNYLFNFCEHNYLFNFYERNYLFNFCERNYLFNFYERNYLFNFCEHNFTTTSHSTFRKKGFWHIIHQKPFYSLHINIYSYHQLQNYYNLPLLVQYSM